MRYKFGFKKSLFCDSKDRGAGCLSAFDMTPFTSQRGSQAFPIIKVCPRPPHANTKTCIYSVIVYSFIIFDAYYFLLNIPLYLLMHIHYYCIFLYIYSCIFIAYSFIFIYAYSLFLHITLYLFMHIHYNCIFFNIYYCISSSWSKYVKHTQMLTFVNTV